LQYRTLGKTGVKVSPYCLGATMFDVAPNGAAYNPSAVLKAELRRRPAAERAAA
jgi:aryl-alcohol dehydrogenase-like predicted oxidoreductase